MVDDGETSPPAKRAGGCGSSAWPSRRASCTDWTIALDEIVCVRNEDGLPFSARREVASAACRRVVLAEQRRGP